MMVDQNTTLLSSPLLDRLKNHPFAGVIEDDSEPAQHFHPDVPRKALIHRRTFQEKTGQRLSHHLAAQTELRHAANFCPSLPAQAAATAALRFACGFNQAVGFHEIAAQTEPAVAAGVDFKPDRKSTRLNSSHSQISYAVFCLQ